MPAVVDIGLTSKQVHEARRIRDAEKRTPGMVRQTLDEKLKAGEEPTRADVKRVVKANAPPKAERKPKPRKNDELTEQVAASLVLDQGNSLEQAAAETGVGSVQVVKTAVAREQGRREAKTEAAIDATSLSLSAQQKLDSAIRQHKHKLDLEFEQRVRAECQTRIEDTILPHFDRTEATYQDLIKARKGLMDKATFNKIRRCLHPDSRQSVTDEKLHEAFRLFSQLEKRLLDEKDSPTSTMQMPRTYAELMALKQKVAASRKAKREHQSMSRA